MVNSKLLKCCPGCGSNDDRNWTFAKKVSLGPNEIVFTPGIVQQFWLIFSQERKRSLRYRLKRHQLKKNQLNRNRFKWNQFHLPNVHLKQIFSKCLEVSEPLKTWISVIFRSSHWNVNTNFSVLHELETGQSGRKSAGEFFLNQSGMPLLKEAWPEIDAKMKAKEKAIATACKLSDDEWFIYFLIWNETLLWFDFSNSININIRIRLKF